MKTKLYRKWLKKVSLTPEFANYIKEPNLKTARLHSLARRYWKWHSDAIRGRFPSQHVKELVGYADSLKCKYKRLSRKYWTAESRLKRAIFEGDDRK